MARVSRTGSGRTWAVDSLPRLAFSKLTTFEGSLIKQVDGTRPISQLITAAAQSSRQSLPEAREFFRRMAEWDHLQFQIADGKEVGNLSSPPRGHADVCSGGQ